MGSLRPLLGGENANTPLLVRDPEHPTVVPDPDLDAMIRERLRGDEIIFHWNELRRGEVSVMLISARFDRLCAWIAAECGHGREGGGGRTLEFRDQKGQWVFLGEGEWIS